MFREMRRSDKLRPETDAIEMLQNAKYGTLAVLGDEGYAYAVPMNHVYLDGKLYFHCAGEGHKLDAIKKNPKVSYCVVGSEEIDQEKVTTIYKSAICFGTARVIEDEEERRFVLQEIIKTLIKDNLENGMAYAEKMLEKTTCFVIDIEHMTGKGLAK